MKRTSSSRFVVFFLSLGAALALTTPAHSAAQSAYLGVGPSFPTGDFADYANTGVLAVGGVTIDVGERGLAIVGEGFFGQNGHDDLFGGGKTQPFGLMAGLMMDFSGEADAGAYVFGQVGMLWHRFVPDEGDSSSESGLGFGGGAGYGFPLGGLSAWVEGRLMSASIDVDGIDSTTSFFGIIVGLSFPLGGNDGM
jgi:hypothetical protein